MFKFVITFSVASLMATVYAVRLDSATIHGTRTARNALNSITTPEDALPVVLIFKSDRELYNPDNIEHVEAENKYIVNGTQFSENYIQTQIFFCTIQNPLKPTERCLAPRNFANSERLRCGENYPTPHWISGTDDGIEPCGIGQSGVRYRVYFPICAPGPQYPYQYRSRALTIYDFCYNENTRKILFTIHYIQSPKLLNTFLLLRDRELRFTYQFDTGIQTVNPNIQHTQVGPGVASLHPNYGVQYLVPNEDMPFGIWKITINQNYNVELQHYNLFNLWSEINKKIRDQVTRQDQPSTNIKYSVRTGVLDNGVVQQQPGLRQIYNRWFKMVTCMSTATKPHQVLSGVVIFMDNFFLSNSSRYYVPELPLETQQALYKELEEYCPQINFCGEYLLNLAIGVGALVRCCPVTPVIANLFGVQPIQHFLHIRFLTISFSQ